jgi:hypothetical protein
MSMFYCAAHDVMEDSDFVGYHVTTEGDEVCEAAAEEAYGSFEDEADYYADWQSQYDDDPNPYAGTYSED